MTQLVGRRHRGLYNQLNQPSHLPSPPPTPGGDNQTTSLFRRPDLILLPDGRRISLYQGWDGVLVTDAIGGSTRPVEDVYMEVLYHLQTRPGGPPPHMAKPLRRNLLGCDPHQDVILLCPLPDGRIIHAFDDGYGVLVTKDDGCTQPVRDVLRNVLCDLWTRPRDPQPTVVDADEEDQPAPQQTATPSPGPYRDDLLNRHCVATKLKLAQRREDREQNVLASKELLGTITPEDSSITNASSLLQPTPHERREPNILASKELVDTTLVKSSIMDASSTQADAVTHSLTPPISARKPAGWNHQFFIREDSHRAFHVYPELDGPFNSLEEAEKAIHRHLDKLRDPEMCTNDGLSRSQIAIRDALHWPDGTKKNYLESNPDEDHMGLLVQALLDKYNEENNLLGDDAYHFEDVVRFQEVYEGDSGGGAYYHLNCTRKTKGGVNNLFFAEVSRWIRERLDEFELTCLHMVIPAVDNGPCYGCKKYNVDMKHPIDAGKYKGGHDRPRRQCCGFSQSGLDIKAMIKAREERIRSEFKKLDLVKSDAGRSASYDGLDKSQLGRRGFLAADARMNKERIRCIYGDRDVAKSDAERTSPCSEGMRERDVAKSDAGRSAAGLNGKYVVPALRLLD